MPLLRVSVTPGAFGDAQRQALVERLTDAACRAESVPDEPSARARAVLIWEELAPGTLYWGAAVADELVIGVFVTYRVSDGVLDPVRRQGFSQAVDTAVAEVVAPADRRTTFTSVIFDEVAEGRWGRDGAVRRLPEMALAAGFEHLRSITGVGDPTPGESGPGEAPGRPPTSRRCPAGLAACGQVGSGLVARPATLVMPWPPRLPSNGADP